MDKIMLRYHEIALKGDNRRWFEDRLAINVRKMVSRALKEKIEVTRSHSRIFLHTAWNPKVEKALGYLFGITGMSPIRTVPTDKQALAQGALEEFQRYIEENGMPSSFRVLCRRSDKALPETSVQLDHFIGGFIKDHFPDLKVQLEKPALTLGIEVHFENSHIWTHRIRGPGGLPVGTNGPLLSLISGGIDSPVASIQALRRGAEVSFIHFDGTPFVGPEARRKVEDLVRIVNRYQPDARPLWNVPFGKIQEIIAKATNPKFRTVLYRRMMVRIACALAQSQGIPALITGESLGQVASQTLENLCTIDAVAPLPILRPLITMDKDEIIAAAERWGTYETSIQPAADCCTLFSDKHPVIRSTLPLIEEQETRYEVKGVMEQGLQGLQQDLIY